MHWLALALALAWSPLSQTFHFASLHSRKEVCVFKRLNSGTRFQKFAVLGVPAHRCHVKERPNCNQSYHLMPKLALCKLPLKEAIPLHPPLPVFAPAGIRLLSLSLLRPVCNKHSQWDKKQLQGQLQRCKLVHLSLNQASWWCRLQFSLSSCQRPILQGFWKKWNDDLKLIFYIF